MQPESPKLLEDIRDGASFILDVVRDRQQSEYEADRLARQAVERNFEIIGEALNRLSKADPATAKRVGPVARIVAFRNILIHAYDNIDHAIVWHVIVNELPTLLAQVTALLNAEGNGGGEEKSDV